MKLTRGVGSPEMGGCWMVALDYYATGDEERWSDHPECVDVTIRPLCMRLNDWLEDGEREEVIGPHLWAPIGTTNAKLRPARIEKIVRFALDQASDAFDAHGIKHDMRRDFGRNYTEARDAAYAAANAAAAADAAADAAVNAAVNAVDAVDAADRKRRQQALLNLILDLCDMSTPREAVPECVSKEQAMRVVCKVSQ